MRIKLRYNSYIVKRYDLNDLLDSWIKELLSCASTGSYDKDVFLVGIFFPADCNEHTSSRLKKENKDLALEKCKKRKWTWETTKRKQGDVKRRERQKGYGGDGKHEQYTGKINDRVIRS